MDFKITEVYLSGVARGDPSQAELVFARSFQAYPTLAKYAYLDAPNMVKWGVPEKIDQKLVQTCCF